MTLKPITQVVTWLFSFSVFAQSFPKAEMLLDHGLAQEAQKELIEIAYATNPAISKDKPKALNLLASIALDKNNLSVAFKTWTKLIKEFPASPEAKTAGERIPLLKSILGKVQEESIDNATARVYLKSADFYSKNRDRIFTIDTSWIPPIEAATFWYNKVIAEFPNTTAARVAYEEKMRTLLGWKEPGQYGERHGAQSNANSTLYFNELESTFREYEKAFPDASALQGFRFIIAQAFWSKKDWSSTRKWLNEIIAKDGGTNSFYKDLAERRLKKIEF